MNSIRPTFMLGAILSLTSLVFGTFSIVAVDTVTREVGSAGASCIDTTNSHHINRINELIPGKGAIVAQAYWDFANLANAKKRMLAGDSPRQIITWLNNNDSERNPQKMQYGIADLNKDSSRSAAFSGAKALDFKNHSTGRNYAIQGNVLIGQRTLDSMETHFLKSKGTFSDQLMQALQGAAFAGADKRCMSEGVSARSAYIRVAKPTDLGTRYYLDLGVPWRPRGVEPIAELQKKYDTWKVTTIEKQKLNKESFRASYHNGVLTWSASAAIEYIQIVAPTGMKILTIPTSQSSSILEASRFPPGLYLALFIKGNSVLKKKLFLILL